jgi:hypothetical protein
MFSAEPVCSCAHFLVHIAHETAGAARTRSSLRPLFEEGGSYPQTSGTSCREPLIHVRFAFDIESGSAQRWVR